jgi:Tol biopolymer transport system component
MGVMRIRRLGLAVLAWLCVIAGGLAFSGGAAALNVHKLSGSFGGEGSEAGKFKEPRGVAVNDTTHNVYVVDRGNTRVQEFSSAGVFIGEFGSGAPGGLKEPTAIAVDNSGDPLDPSLGDVYIVDERYAEGHEHDVVDKFTESGVYEGQLTAGEGGVFFGSIKGVAVEPRGVLWVSNDGHFESFSDDRVNTFQSNTNSSLICDATNGLAADSAEFLYYDCHESGGAWRLFTSGTAQVVQGLIDRTKEVEYNGVAADSSNGEVYFIAGQGQFAGQGVYAFDSRDLPVEQFGSSVLSASRGIAVDSATHTVYVSDTASDSVVVFGQFVLPDVSTGEEPVDIEHEGVVTLDGTVNPDGLPVTSCQFEYGTEASYGNVVPCESDPGSGSSSVTVHAVVSGLTPLTTYHYRLVATNANGPNPGIDRSFTAPQRPKLDSESVSDVTSASATFAALINPGAAPTTFHVEYGDNSSYGSSLSARAGSGSGDVEVSVHPQDLVPHTAYHYRVVAESPLGRIDGEDRVFTTQPVASGFELLDGRAWEMVSPPEKLGSSILPPGGGGSTGNVAQAGMGGSAITYGATSPTEAEPPGNRAPEHVQELSRRGAGGWSTSTIATPHNAVHVSLSNLNEYRVFSSNLSLGLVASAGTLPLSEETSEYTPYLRHDAVCGESPKACYQPLVTAADVAPGVKFGGSTVEDFAGGDEFEGASPDLSHVVIGTTVALTAGGAPGLYEWAAGKLTFIGSGDLGDSGGSLVGKNVRHAVSDDGSRVIFTKVGVGSLFLYDTASGNSRRLDVAEPGVAGGEGEAVFQTASADGSKVFFTDGVRLTVDSHSTRLGTPDLYEFDLGTGKLTDLTVTSNPSEPADVRGLAIGASEDGSYVYFVANGVLAAGASPGNCPAAGGVCNLYVSHDGVATFIGSLSTEDFYQRPLLIQLTGRVSPDGRWLSFMSDRSLTGYDNHDARSGVADEEVFLYDASAQRVMCASCNPTGARPVGAFDPGANAGSYAKPEPPELLVDTTYVWPQRWLTALVPGWALADVLDAFSQPRYLSDAGRLFFDSSDALSPQDVNGTWDVYEYEPPGVGGCTSSSVSFSEPNGGCVGLVSSGSASEESAFLDASENGNDVFFLTNGGLVPQDYDGAADIYDAHVCSAGSCVSPAPVAPPPCSTGDSCKAAPSPQPEGLGAPSSETFSGAGNVLVEASGGGGRQRSVASTRKLARALAACRKVKPKRRRVACEQLASKRFARKAAVGSRAGKSASGRHGR